TVFVTGESYGSSGYTDYATIAYRTATGTSLWTKRYAGAGSQNSPTALGVNPDGSTVYVTGYSAATGTGFDYATVAYGAEAGGTRWVKRYNGPASSEDEAHDLGVSPDGSTVFVTGDSYAGGTTGTDYATVAYNASTGARLWVKRYDGRAYNDD